MPHGGLLGPGMVAQHEHRLAKHLICEVVDKALGVQRRNPFDALIADLAREVQRSERPMRKALVLLRKPDGDRRRTVLVFTRGSTLRASKEEE